MVATSLTVTNSVTFNTLDPKTCASVSASESSLWASLLFLLYFAPFPFEDFPWSFSKVSLTCFCTSASVSSLLTGTGLLWAFPPLDPPGLFDPGLDPPGLPTPDALFWLPWPGVPGLLILFLFLLEASFLAGVFDLSSVFFFTFSNCLRSIFFPVNLGPFNFLYWVFIVSDCSEGSVESVCSVFSETTSFFGSKSWTLSVITSFCSEGSDGFLSVSLGACSTSFSWVSLVGGIASFSPSLLSIFWSTTGSLLTSAFFASISILPTVLTCNFSALALKTSSFFSSSNLFFSIFASNSSLIASFSFRFSSPTSLDAAFLLASVSKPSCSTW